MLTPQPIGIFSLPAGYLLLPESDSGAETHKRLMQGKIPDEFPPEWRFYGLALKGDLAAALESLPAEGTIARYNRFVLESSPEQYAELRTALDGVLLKYLDVVAYTLGYIPNPPDAADLTGEARAFVLMAQASQQLEQEDVPAALGLLREAINAAKDTTPVFAAQLACTMLEAERGHSGSTIVMIPQYRQVLRTLQDSDLSDTEAETWLALGIVYQELSNAQRGSLMEAIKCYQHALRVFNHQHHPESYALAQSNLALAYLAMPLIESTDQLRAGVAIQALREALKVYGRETHPEKWASAQMNLANALQYVPTAHPQENLEQAVELYEDILNVRNPLDDPLGYARTLANQANALAHLGIFSHAISKLQQAHTLFYRNSDKDGAEASLELLNQIEARQRELTIQGRQNGAS